MNLKILYDDKILLRVSEHTISVAVEVGDKQVDVTEGDLVNTVVTKFSH